MSTINQHKIIKYPEKFESRLLQSAMGAVRGQEAAKRGLSRNLNYEFWASEVGQDLIACHRYIFGTDDLTLLTEAARLTGQTYSWVHVKILPSSFEAPNLNAFCLFNTPQQPFSSQGPTTNKIRVWLQNHRDLIWSKTIPELRSMMIGEWGVADQGLAREYVGRCIGELRPLAPRWYVSRAEVLRLAQGEAVK